MTLRGHLLDLSPLRDNAAFGAFWLGSSISGFGAQMSAFALLYYVWDLTHSAVIVGMLGVVQGVPLLVFGFLGGHLADRVNRRTLLLVGRSGQAVLGGITAAVVLAGIADLVMIYLLLGVGSALAALTAPVGNTIAPRVLRPDELSAGLALSRLSSQLAMLGGPALAGVLVAAAGVGVCVLVDAATSLAALWGIAHIPRAAAVPQSGPGDPDGGLLVRVTAGLAFMVRNRAVRAAALIDLAATVLALPAAMFPVINAERFGGSPATMGLMLPAIGLGGVLAGLVSGRVTGYPFQGRIMLVSCAVWGAAIAGFGASPHLGPAIAFLVVAGAADTCTVVSRGSIVQLATPDAIRGRVNSIDYLVGAGGPSAGNARAGIVAGATSAATSCVLGGLACVLAAVLIAASNPNIRRWRVPATEVAR